MTKLTTSKFKGFTMFDLEIIGIVLMFVDHIHQMFVPMGAANWPDRFGRPVAVLFFFISVIGFSHTRSKEKYMLRLYLGMAIMTLGSFTIQKIIGYEDVQLMNNIFRDLLVGTLMMYGIDKISEGRSSQKFSKIVWGIVIILFPIISSAILAALMSNPSTIMAAAWGVNIIPALLFTKIM